MPPDRPQRVTLPTLQILAAFMSDLSRDDWYGRALSVHTGLGSGTVLQCLYRLENWGWLESRWEDRNVATRDGRPPRRFYRLTGVGQRGGDRAARGAVQGAGAVLRTVEGWGDLEDSCRPDNTGDSADATHAQGCLA
jgi:PadR family transcriptional regulator, regulatory protein PadR